MYTRSKTIWNLLKLMWFMTSLFPLHHVTKLSQSLSQTYKKAIKISAFSISLAIRTQCQHPTQCAVSSYCYILPGYTLNALKPYSQIFTVTKQSIVSLLQRSNGCLQLIFYHSSKFTDTKEYAKMIEERQVDKEICKYMSTGVKLLKCSYTQMQIKHLQQAYEFRLVISYVNYHNLTQSELQKCTQMNFLSHIPQKSTDFTVVFNLHFCNLNT